MTFLLGRALDAAFHKALEAHRTDAEARISASVTPLLEWIRGAEKHLAALQADHNRLGALYEERIAQLDQFVTRASLLEARLDDLERAHTAMAAAISKARVRDEIP
jgi:hypothetical protein